MTNLYYLILNYILNETIVHVVQRFKTMGEFRFIELLNLSHFYAYKKFFQWKCLQFWMYTRYIGFRWTEMQAKTSLCRRFHKASVKHTRSHRDNTGTSTKPTFGGVTKFLQLPHWLPMRDCFFLLKHVNNYMTCSQSEEQFINKNLLKKL